MRITYYILFAFWYLLSLLPLRVLYFISDFILYPLLYHIVGYRLKSRYRKLNELKGISSIFLLIIWLRPSNSSPCLKNR